MRQVLQIDDLLHRRVAQTPDAQRADFRPVKPGVVALTAGDEDHADGAADDFVHRGAQKALGHSVRPVDIVDRHAQRPVRGDRLEPVAEDGEARLTRFVGGAAPGDRRPPDAEQRGERGGPRTVDAERGEAVGEFAVAHVGRVQRVDRHAAHDELADRQQRGGLPLIRAARLEPGRPARDHGAAQMVDQHRLADAGVARDDDRTAFACRRRPPSLFERGLFVLTAEHAPVADPRPAPDRAAAAHPEYVDRRAARFEFARAQRLEIEMVLRQPAHGGCHQDIPGAALGLQMRRHVRGVADNVRALRRPRLEIADDDNACLDADAHRKRAVSRGQSGKGADDIGGRRDAADGVVLMRARISPIGQHAVADIARDKAAVSLDRGRDRPAVADDEIREILRIEPGRQGGGADDVAEHHGYLTPLRVTVLQYAGGRGHMRASPYVTSEYTPSAKRPDAVPLSSFGYVIPLTHCTTCLRPSRGSGRGRTRCGNPAAVRALPAEIDTRAPATIVTRCLDPKGRI